jgi:hypothetical protein
MGHALRVFKEFSQLRIKQVPSALQWRCRIRHKEIKQGEGLKFTVREYANQLSSQKSCNFLKLRTKRKFNQSKIFGE